jgi:hypothetical protein
MRQIKPVQFTNEQILAEYLKVVIIEDDLTSFARFAFILFTSEMVTVDSGIVRCEGTDYTDWDGNNEFPYIYVASQINIELI